MTITKNDIDLDSAIEAEEINAPEDKLAESSRFHRGGAGSKPVGSTIDIETSGLNPSCGNDWYAMHNANGFTIKRFSEGLSVR